MKKQSHFLKVLFNIKYLIYIHHKSEEMKRESKFCEGRIMFELNIDKEIFLEI